MKTLMITGLAFILGLSCTAQAQDNDNKKYFCSPCECENDGKIFDAGGKCPGCGMRLREVGTSNFEMASISASNMIVYASDKKDSTQQLFYKSLNASSGEKLIGPGSAAHFSPDGRKIVFSRSENSIWIYDIIANKLTDLSSKIDSPGIQLPVWDATGKSIFFSAGTFPNVGIYKIDPDNGKTEPIITTGGLRYGCAPSPNGHEIAYRCAKGTDKDRQRGIAIFDLSTKEERYVSPIGEYCTWSPDGKQLAFHWPDSTGNFCIYTVNSNGADLRKIAGSEDNDYELPCWSPDGNTIYFQTNKRHGSWEIWSMNKDGSNQQPVIWN